MDELDEYVHASTGDRLFVEYVAPGKPLYPTIVDLLNALEREGTTAEFLNYVYVKRPDRPGVQQLIVRLCPKVLEGSNRVVAVAAQEAGVPQADPPVSALAPGLQRNVRPYLARLDARVWLERLLRIERQVCLVERGGNPAGTGFLIGRDAVLTNWHVVEPAMSAGRIGEIACRFDFIRLLDGTIQAGQSIALHADGCLDHAPYSQAERTTHPEDPPPTTAELDYALLRLAIPAGEQMVEGSARGWITLPATPMPLPQEAPLLIVQHPEGQPMKLAMDTQAVIGRNANGTRIRYKTNTDPGSSGSPCFTMEWDLVALHHYGDPSWQRPLFNQGVPIELIRARLAATGHGAAIGIATA